jgi:anti-sigma-K factor RskA
MDRNKCDLSEIQIVDDILGNLPPEASRTLQQHLASCPSCRQLYQEWRHLLQERPETAPSPRVYRRLGRRMRRRHIRRKWFRPANVMGFVSAAAAMVLMTGIFSLYREQPPSVPSSPSAEQPPHAEHLPHAMVLDARTISFPIASQHARSAGVYGHVWVNGYTDEVFFRVRGLVDDQEHDYQVWLIKAVRRENAGLLRMEGEFAELYSQGQNIREVKLISISKEPKGGSAAPTAPEMILVDFISVHNVPGTRPE